MRNFFAAILLVLFLTTIQFAQSDEINIIPKVADYEQKDGIFVLTRQTKIVVAKSAFEQNGKALREEIFRRYGFKLQITNKPQKRNFILFDLVGQGHAALREKGEYHLIIEDQAVRVLAGPEGQFYAIQTLLQLMPPETEDSIKVHAATIYDGPRFPYRGMHLDVGRHFMPVSFIKKYIDLMSQYKFNYFHWHLTEDQGWRIEIKKYPTLTEIGSKRPETVKERNLSPYIGDGIPVEGFYTQEQIKDVVTYAKARYITVIPEIELPGHASAALAAYPQFGCKADYKYKVQTTWGIFKEVFCPTEETFKFLQDVLDETIALFPDSPYIHIGGDEVLKDHWKESAFVQELKKRENLKDEHEVQSYFVRRIEKYLNSKGKKMIGWDEILEGGLAPNATVMSWRGMKGGIEAAKSKHDVIMTPTDFAYLNFGQGDPAYEPIAYPDYLPLAKVYSFEPIPKELTPDEARYVIGGQGNLWTEYIKTPSQAEYMLFPRMLALAEILWSRPEDKNYTDFQRRLAAHYPRLDKQGVNYRIPEPAGLQNVVTSGGRVEIRLSSLMPKSKIYYTLDGTAPDEKSKLYDAPFTVELREGEKRELKTIVVGPTGRKSSIYAATLIRSEMLQPTVLAEKKPGVRFALIHGNEAVERSKETGETRSILLNQFDKRIDLKQPFAVTFDGYFNVPNDGVYELQIDSTWDTTLVFAGQTLIDDVGTKDRKVKSAIVPLKAGYHKISLRYNHRGGDSNFRFRWGIKGQGLRQAYGAEFVH